MSSKALAEMLRRTWLVGVERESLEALAERLTAQQKPASCPSTRLRSVSPASGDGIPVVTPPKAKQVEVRTPEDNGLSFRPLAGRERGTTYWMPRHPN